MKKTKILVIMSLVLSLLVGAIPNVGTSVEAASNIPDAKVAFINVCDEKASKKEAGKADATVIEANKKMVLVDCGKAKTFKYLKKRITERYANMLGKDVNDIKKVKLEAIVITHNHNDHMGALEKILDDSFFEVKEVVYPNICEQCGEKYGNCTCSEWTNLDTVKVAVDDKDGVINTALKPLPKSYDENDLEPHIIHLGATKVKVYRPINKAHYVKVCKYEDSKYEDPKNKAKTKHDNLWANNRSMIVRVVTGKNYLTDTSKGMTALLLGDLYVNGLIAAKKVYGNKIFNKEYKVCKVGHHGVRPSSFFSDKVNDSRLASHVSYMSNTTNKTITDAEIEFYNKFIGADNYVFNVTDSMVRTLATTTNDDGELKYKLVLERYNKFISKLSNCRCVKYGSAFHMNTDGVFSRNTTKCEKVDVNYFVGKLATLDADDLID